MTCFADKFVHTKKLIMSPDDLRILTDNLTAEWEGWTIRVKAGYRTDGASIPRMAWRVVGHPWAQYLPAAIVHDILYGTEVWDRKEADRCFLGLMQCIGVGWLKSHVIYSAVRMFGGLTWSRHTDASRNYARKYLEVYQ